jgi:NAD(P)-dependent dehydrogenase (short-subunit alcohol dehydrogenase family)
MSLNPDGLPVAVVTGASRGLGKATAEALARQGYHVIMLCRDVRDAADHAMGLSHAGFSVEPRKVDVASSAEVSSVTKHITEEYGQVDLLVNNAGVFLEASAEGTDDPLRVSVTAVMQTFNVNAMGAMRLIQAVVPLMREGGRIVNVSSGMGRFSEIEGNYLGYRMSKTAMNGLTAVYAEALQNRGITVNAVCPGWVRTDMGGVQAERDIAEGIDTILWLATSDEATGASGGFYRDRKLLPW